MRRERRLWSKKNRHSLLQFYNMNLNTYKTMKKKISIFIPEEGWLKKMAELVDFDCAFGVVGIVKTGKAMYGAFDAVTGIMLNSYSDKEVAEVNAIKGLSA